MNILNKRTIIIATASLLCFGGSHLCVAKPAKPAAGGASHMQRGIELARQKNSNPPVPELTTPTERIRKAPPGYASRAPPYRKPAPAVLPKGARAGPAPRHSSSSPH